MRYDISKHKAPEMPNLGKGAEFQYSDLIWKEMCGQMACCPRDKMDDKRVFLC